jgi:hypothetical protein
MSKTFEHPLTAIRLGINNQNGATTLTIYFARPVPKRQVDLRTQLFDVERRSQPVTEEPRSEASAG